MKKMYFALLILTSACGDTKEKLFDDTGGGKDIGHDIAKDTGNDSANQDLAEDQGPWNATPILAREVQTTKTCSTITAFKTLKNEAKLVVNPHLALRNEKLWVGRAEQVSPFATQSALRFGELSSNGQVTNDTHFENSEWYSPALQIHPNDNGSFLTISQHEGKEIQSTVFDAQGNKGATTTIAQSSQNIIGVESLSGHGKIMVLWTEQGTGQTEKLLVIDSANGEVLDESTLFTYGIIGQKPFKMLRTSNGFTFVRTKRSNDGLFNIISQTFDKNGKETGTENVVYTSKKAMNDTMWGNSSIAFVELGAGFLMAWSEREGVPDLEMKSMVRVAKLDKDLKIVGEVVDLTTSEIHIDFSIPSFKKIDDSIALFWSKGSQIYFCGGCYPDYKLSMILLDPGNLNPLSPELKIESDGVAGGLVERQILKRNNQLNIMSHVQYHVSKEAAFGIVECQ